MLIGTKINGSDLTGCILNGAKLQNAQLAGCDLVNASLRGADLCNANLQYTNLNGADLSGANVQGALFKGTVGLTEKVSRELKARGAIFEDSALHTIDSKWLIQYVVIPLTAILVGSSGFVGILKFLEKQPPSPASLRALLASYIWKHDQVKKETRLLDISKIEPFCGKRG